MIGLGPLACVMALSDSYNVVDLFILHPWNPIRLKVCPQFFIVQTVGPPDCGALGLCLLRLPLPPALDNVLWLPGDGTGGEVCRLQLHLVMPNESR